MELTQLLNINKYNNISDVMDNMDVSENAAFVFAFS